MDEDASVGEEFVCVAHCRLDRTKAHLKGQHAKSIRQQVDATSMAALRSLMEAAATAIDTTFYDAQKVPRVRIVFLILNEVR